MNTVLVIGAFLTLLNLLIPPVDTRINRPPRWRERDNPVPPDRDRKRVPPIPPPQQPK